MSGKVKFYLASCTVFSLALAACGSGGEAEPSAMEEEAESSEEAAPAPEQASAPAAPVDGIYGSGGLVEKCIDRVNEMTGGYAIGMSRVDEAESGVMVYVNVQDAEAPWQCFGNRDGTLQEAYYGGDEGAL